MICLSIHEIPYFRRISLSCAKPATFGDKPQQRCCRLKRQQRSLGHLLLHSAKSIGLVRNASFNENHSHDDAETEKTSRRDKETD
jgi:hypothetical protein